MVYHDLVRFFIVGFVSGWIAAIAIRGRVFPRGCFAYIFLGLVGSLSAGFLFRAIGLPSVARVLAASLGAVIVLLMRRLWRGNL